MSIARYSARRLLHSIFLLIGVSLLSFLFLELAPGDFFDKMRIDPQISPETVTALRKQYGLDRPLPIRYGHWLWSVAQGEFGYSFAYNVPASTLLWSRAWNTLVLSGISVLLAWLLAIPLGVWGAAGRPPWGKPWRNKVVVAGTSTLLAIPDLLMALLLLLLAVRTGWFPVGGMVSLNFDDMTFGGKLFDLASHLFLPASALVLILIPILVRHVHAAMAEVLDSTFIRNARACGIPRRRLFFRHALPVAANPLISLFGFSLASLLSVSLLVEVVMSWPGLGPLLLEAILARDLHIVIGAVVLSTLFLVAGNLVADILLYALDPRIRIETGERTP
jgi:peptide/nickel transport system permease protein